MVRRWPLVSISATVLGPTSAAGEWIRAGIQLA